MTTGIDKQDIRALFEWYASIGADLDVAREPTNWFELAERQKGEARAPVQARSPARATEPRPSGRPEMSAPAPGLHAAGQSRTPQRSGDRPALLRSSEAVMAAREAAGAAQSLDVLHERLAAFEGCGLKATAKSLCFYRGAPQARLMVIGEAPGRDEDIQGKPFVGRAGRLLDKMLAAINLSENDVHITNIVYWRPPGNRNPTPEEAEVCRPFLARQIELVAPDVLFILGRPAANQLLETTQGIMKIRGKWRSFDASGRSIRAMASLHPAYLLRTPAAKRMAWRDLLAVRSAIDEAPTD